MDQPYLRVVRGEPTPEELAALLVVVGAQAQARVAPAPPPDRPSLWANRARLVRRPLAPGPGAWRASAFPSHPA